MRKSVRFFFLVCSKMFLKFYFFIPVFPSLPSWFRQFNVAYIEDIQPLYQRATSHLCAITTTGYYCAITTEVPFSVLATLSLPSYPYILIDLGLSNTTLHKFDFDCLTDLEKSKPDHLFLVSFTNVLQWFQ